MSAKKRVKEPPVVLADLEFLDIFWSMLWFFFLIIWLIILLHVLQDLSVTTPSPDWPRWRG